MTDELFNFVYCRAVAIHPDDVEMRIWRGKAHLRAGYWQVGLVEITVGLF
jgi:hypothetical protein